MAKMKHYKRQTWQKDEFYTQLTDIEAGNAIIEHFRGKVVLLVR